MPKISELRALLAKATPAPWHHAKDGDDFYALFTDDDEYAFGCRDEGDEEDNAELAAAAVNALPALLDVAEAAEEHSCNGWNCSICAALAKMTIPNGTTRSPK